jgi:hypothetical protein
MKKQTAVEFLFKQIYGDTGHIGSFTTEGKDAYEAFQQAIEMERSQIKEAQMDMFHKLNDIPCDAAYLEKREVAETFCKKYYNETYGGDHIGGVNEMVNHVPDVGKMVEDVEIGKKRWDDWDEFNKKACYPEDHQSAFADGFTRGAKWVNEIAKETLYTEEQVREIVEKSRATGLTAEYIMLSLKQSKQ